MQVSFVIPAYNEEMMLPSTIGAIHEAVKSLGYEYEIVVADDESNDQTAEIAAGLGAMVVSTSNRQIAATRNAGAQASSGEMIVWVDADTRVTTGSVRGAFEAMSQGAAGGGGRVYFDKPCPLYARVLLPPMMILYRLVGIASGAFIYCTRETFETTGGFDESIYAGEELIMSRSIRKCGKFAWVKDPVSTSARKLRTYSGREIVTELMKLGFGGMRGARTRKNKELWYGPRRVDTAPAPMLDAESTQQSGGK